MGYATNSPGNGISINFSNPTCSYLCDGAISVYAANATQFALNDLIINVNPLDTDLFLFESSKYLKSILK